MAKSHPSNNLPPGAGLATRFFAIRHCALILIAVAGGSTWAAAQHSEEERKQDIQRHEAMAAAHQAAAQCLKSGKDEKVCLAELQRACKGLGIGKYCGMKHAH
ncbi:hypothetical protein [Hydrogenophaga sp. 5NK40-0174]|uniref:hypothetical protein n=1 Tax=Hydrogenophaga sp. 5NK40-0174 TaxID=3127649 RepID=UPI003101DAAA